MRNRAPYPDPQLRSGRGCAGFAVSTALSVRSDTIELPAGLGHPLPLATDRCAPDHRVPLGSGWPAAPVIPRSPRWRRGRTPGARVVEATDAAVKQSLAGLSITGLRPCLRAASGLLSFATRPRRTDMRYQSSSDIRQIVTATRYTLHAPVSAAIAHASDVGMTTASASAFTLAHLLRSPSSVGPATLRSAGRQDRPRAYPPRCGGSSSRCSQAVAEAVSICRWPGRF